uniref:Uncharacterized protein n=1 Tax=Globodera rostochiensis TaxID=31243 RepID=A0A914GNN1_GLORO
MRGGNRMSIGLISHRNRHRRVNRAHLQVFVARKRCLCVNPRPQHFAAGIAHDSIARDQKLVEIRRIDTFRAPIDPFLSLLRVRWICHGHTGADILCKSRADFITFRNFQKWLQKKPINASTPKDAAPHWLVGGVHFVRQWQILSTTAQKHLHAQVSCRFNKNLSILRMDELPDVLDNEPQPIAVDEEESFIVSEIFYDRIDTDGTILYAVKWALDDRPVGR